MPNLMNMSKEECSELIDVLEKEQSQLQSGIGRSPRWTKSPCNDRRQETVKRLLWKARAGATTPDVLDPSELIECRMGGYC